MHFADHGNYDLDPLFLANTILPRFQLWNHNHRIGQRLLRWIWFQT